MALYEFVRLLGRGAGVEKKTKRTTATPPATLMMPVAATTVNYSLLASAGPISPLHHESKPQHIFCFFSLSPLTIFSLGWIISASHTLSANLITITTEARIEASALGNVLRGALRFDLVLNVICVAKSLSFVYILPELHTGFGPVQVHGSGSGPARAVEPLS